MTSIGDLYQLIVSQGFENKIQGSSISSFFFFTTSLPSLSNHTQADEIDKHTLLPRTDTVILLISMQTRFPFSITPHPINQRGRLFHFYLCSCFYAMSAPHVPLYEPHSLFSCALSAVRKWVDLLFSRIKTETQPTPCLPCLPPTTPRIITSTTPSAAPLLAASSQRVPVIQRHHLRIST